MSEKQSRVYLTSETLETCKVESAISNSSLSGAINGIVSQHRVVMTENLPILSENEKNAFRALFNGYMPSESMEEEASILPFNLEEGYKHDPQVRQFIGLDEDARKLIERVNGWTVSQRLAVIYDVKTFWNNN